MELSPVLSICIPSYNRAGLLGELLGRIAEEVGDDKAGDIGIIEIVVTDNCSPDDTRQVVQSYRNHLTYLTYIRHSENIGADRNFLAAVGAATGRYCWLMGDDDFPEPGAIRRLVQVLEAHPGIAGCSLDRFSRSFDLSSQIPEDAFPEFPKSRMLSGADEVFSKIGYYLGYLSGQVVERALWNEVVATSQVDKYYNAYVHVYVIGMMLKKRPDWLVLKERLVTWRADNDSFMSSGRYRRLEIDVVGFEQNCRGVFGTQSAVYRTVRDKIATGHLRSNIMTSRIEGSWDVKTARQTRKLAIRYYSRSFRFWLITAPVLFAPRISRPVFVALRNSVRRWRAFQGRSRNLTDQAG